MPSGAEWFIVLAVVLVIFGGSQLPKLARNLGKAQKEFKDGLAEGQEARRRGAGQEATTGDPAHRAPCEAAWRRQVASSWCEQPEQSVDGSGGA